MDAKTRRPERRLEQPVAKRRVIVIGTRKQGRWKVRMSLWRYLASTAISQ
jgi:hypothetical protein